MKSKDMKTCFNLMETSCSLKWAPFKEFQTPHAAQSCSAHNKAVGPFVTQQHWKNPSMQISLNRHCHAHDFHIDLCVCTVGKWGPQPVNTPHRAISSVTQSGRSMNMLQKQRRLFRTKKAFKVDWKVEGTADDPQSLFFSNTCAGGYIWLK